MAGTLEASLLAERLADAERQLTNAAEEIIALEAALVGAKVTIDILMERNGHTVHKSRARSHQVRD